MTCTRTPQVCNASVHDRLAASTLLFGHRHCHAELGIGLGLVLFAHERPPANKTHRGTQNPHLAENGVATW